jgi:hypothetical protein
MSESKQNIANLFLAFADALKSMDNQEYELLIQGKAKLRLVKDQKAKAKPVRSSHSDETVSELAQKLNNAESREVAAELLASINQPRSRKFLVLLAEACGVNAGSKDNIARIEEKLIENVVGTRLRSEAIQKVAF